MIYKFRNDIEMSNLRKNDIKTAYFRPWNINYEAIDSYIYSQSGYWALKILEPNVLSLQFGDIIDQSKPLLLCFSMKKDLEYIYFNWKDIKNAWNKKKIDLNKIYQNCSFLLILVTQVLQVENGRIREKFDKSSEDIWFLFADAANNSYFFEKNV